MVRIEEKLVKLADQIFGAGLTDMEQRENAYRYYCEDDFDLNEVDCLTHDMLALARRDYDDMILPKAEDHFRQIFDRDPDYGER